MTFPASKHLLSTDCMHSTKWLSLHLSFWNLLSPLSLSGPLLVPSGWLTWASNPPPPPPPHPYFLQTRADSRLAHPSSLLPLRPEKETPCAQHPTRHQDKHDHNAFFSPWQNSPLSSFLPTFSPTDERKTPRGPGREGLSMGSQPTPPSEANRARACLG